MLHLLSSRASAPAVCTASPSLSALALKDVLRTSGSWGADRKLRPLLVFTLLNCSRINADPLESRRACLGSVSICLPGCVSLLPPDARFLFMAGFCQELLAHPRSAPATQCSCHLCPPLALLAELCVCQCVLLSCPSVPKGTEGRGEALSNLLGDQSAPRARERDWMTACSCSTLRGTLR